MRICDRQHNVLSGPLVVYGAGGHGKVVLDAALTAEYEVHCVIDDAPSDADLLGVKVLRAGTYKWPSARCVRFIVGVGANSVRARLFGVCVDRGIEPATICHPTSLASPRCSLGGGVFLAAGAVVMVGAVVGDNVIINTGASIDHDCHIGAHAHICPGVRLAGEVRVGEYTMIGTGASVLPGVRVGAHCVVGAGAVVNHDIPDHSVAIGLPARVTRSVTPADLV